MTHLFSMGAAINILHIGFYSLCLVVLFLGSYWAIREKHEIKEGGNDGTGSSN